MGFSPQALNDGPGVSKHEKGGGGRAKPSLRAMHGPTLELQRPKTKLEMQGAWLPKGTGSTPLTSLRFSGWNSVLRLSSDSSPLSAASLGGEHAENSLQAKELSAVQPV